MYLINCLRFTMNYNDAQNKSFNLFNEELKTLQNVANKQFLIVAVW